MVILRFAHQALLAVILAVFMTASVNAYAAQDAAINIEDDSLIVQIFNRINAARRLSAEDALRYKKIFEFQEDGNFARANDEIKRLKDHRLLGYVLYERYLHKDYSAGYEELAAWMRRYNDHPGAQTIFDLALRKKPKDGGSMLVSPKIIRGVAGPYDADVGPMAQSALDPQGLSPRAKDIVVSIKETISDRPSQSLKRLNVKDAATVFSAEEYDVLRGYIASSFYFNKNTGQAFTLASASADRSGKDVPQAGWIAGLSAWRQGRYAVAAKYFEIAAESPRSSAWMASAAAYWSARAWLRAKQPQKVSPWLVKAADYPRTFYGIIALKALGMEQSRFYWDMPKFDASHYKTLAKNASGRRAIALVDVGRPDLAQFELKQVNPGNDEDMQEALIAFANEKGMPSVLLRVGGSFKNSEGALFDAALYPETPWTPEDGFEVDRALVYAFIRQESRFDSSVKNKGSGAIGLMQLMPQTAGHMAKVAGDGSSDSDSDLLDPVTNIDLGQKYLQYLLNQQGISKNLFRLTMAYNAGPGKLARFQQLWQSEEDPLLFIESFPVAETRMFVERVLTNYWIYRVKYGMPTESLDQVAQGYWPLYEKKQSP